MRPACASAMSRISPWSRMRTPSWRTLSSRTSFAMSCPARTSTRAAVRQAEKRIAVAVALREHAEQARIALQWRGFRRGRGRVGAPENRRGHDGRRPALRRLPAAAAAATRPEHAPAPMRQRQRKGEAREQRRGPRRGAPRPWHRAGGRAHAWAGNRRSAISWWVAARRRRSTKALRYNGARRTSLRSAALDKSARARLESSSLAPAAVSVRAACARCLPA